MFDHYTLDAAIDVAKARYQDALQDAETHRRLAAIPRHNRLHAWRDRMGDWLIDAGQRVKTGNVADAQRPSLVHPQRPY